MQPSDYHPLLQRQVDALLGGGASVPAELQALLQTVNGSYKDFERQIAHRTDQLIASTSRAYSFLDTINMGFILCDTSGEVVLTNSSVRRMLAYKDETQPELPKDSPLTLESLSQLFTGELNIKDLIAQCLQSGHSFEKDDINLGKHVLHVYLAPLLNEPNAQDKQILGVIVLVNDVTEQKVLERSKDEFLTIASHELRTPLTAIRGNSALIQKYYADKVTDRDMAEIIDDIHDSSVRLIDIVNDFLDVAALEQHKITMKPEAFSINDVASQVVHELTNLCADKGIVLSADATVANVPAVMADKQRIKQVLINLVGNAVKFTDKGSITISAQADQSYVYITVTDTGRGMSPENQKLLFRKFQQAGDSILTRDASKGTGLGLYISKQIVELSGGGIGLKSSAENVGSAFAFSLPLAKQA